MHTISRLFIYPIKSCAGVEVESLTFDECGPVGDRRFMLVDESGQFLTQRTLPAMAHIYPHYSGNDLQVTAAGHEPLSVAAGAAAGKRQVVVWKDEMSAGDCGDEAAQWFSAVLNTPCRLVAVQADTQRQINRKYADEGEWVGFADGYPLLVTTQASLDVLSAAVGRTVQMERFRPNIVLQGNDAFAELRWTKLKAEDGELLLCKPCERCVIPTRDIATQQREGDVLEALKTHCRIDGKIIFGQNALIRGFKTLRIRQALVSE